MVKIELGGRQVIFEDEIEENKFLLEDKEQAEELYMLLVTKNEDIESLKLSVERMYSRLLSLQNEFY